ncbi:GspH/FimT family pseudopilin [Acidovorax soli]|uniref:GspH/FimT family pseudopilin n=1 Tax=Acidovorax soli TaxID=592050 RepID=UPI0032B2FFA8
MLVRPVPQRGFTLIELMTTITVLAVLTMVALPAFQSFVANQRVRNASFDLMAALTLARSQAITQNGTVQLTKSGGEWNAGWTVNDGTRNFGSQEALPNLSITDTNGGASVIYGKDGRITTTATKFTIKPTTAISGVAPRCIAIGLSGIPSSTQGAC